ncbi:MAG: indolepyruvate decarboxylase [Pseudonocardia sp.]|nr:indolepyruvate decarboxylase [Pseudonocardia sp.]
MLRSFTVGDYLLTRLAEIGIRDLFGVPGPTAWSFSTTCWTTSVSVGAYLTTGNATGEIDRVLATSLREHRPGYLVMPTDVAASPVDRPTSP